MGASRHIVLIHIKFGPAFDEGQEEGGAKEDEEGQIHVPEL